MVEKSKKFDYFCGIERIKKQVWISNKRTGTEVKYDDNYLFLLIIIIYRIAFLFSIFPLGQTIERSYLLNQLQRLR